MSKWGKWQQPAPVYSFTLQEGKVMSLESVSARVAEIEARLKALAPEPLAVPRPAQPSTEGVQPPERVGHDGESGPKPFNVALAQAAGQAALRPVSGRFSPYVEHLIEQYSAKND